MTTGHRRWTLYLAAAAVLAAAAWGVAERLRDPLSSPALAAEDPFTHMALVREHLEDGRLDPLNEGARLYPPGLHSLIAAVWVFTGADLYGLMRFGPVALGALGILGAGLLAGRHAGPVAAAAAAWAAAVAPELVLRTTMMAPTALDLALIPFFLYALAGTLRGSRAWAGAALVMGLFLVLAHPWAIAVLAPAGALFLLLAATLPWPASRGAPPTWEGLALCAALLGAPFALALSGCWGGCGPGFEDVLGPAAARQLDAASVALLALALAPLAIRLAAPRAWQRLPPLPSRPPGLAARIAVAWALGLAAALGTWLAVAAGLPEHVHLVNMFGWPILALAAAGLLLAPFARGPLAYLGVALVAATYPFVVANPLHSPFWPHRTAAYLGVGLVLLAATAAAAAARGCQAALAALAARAQRRAASAPRPASAFAAGTFVPALALAVVAGGLAGAPAEQPGWYRLHEPCEFAGLRQVAAETSRDPRRLVVTGTWQAKLTLAALGTNASRMWYKPELFADAGEQASFARSMADERPLVVADSLLAREHPEADPAFLHKPPWREAGRWDCATDGKAVVLATFELRP